MSGRPESADALDRFVERMPKAELHVHLEGTIRPRTLLRLASRRRVLLPADTVAGVRKWFRFRDFEEFVGIYLTCSRCLRDPEDFQLLVAEFLAEQRRQNVLYCEAHLTIGFHVANGVNAGEVADALAESIADGERRHGVILRLIPDIVRDTPERADLTLEWALEGRGRGVVALGLSGFESTSAAPFGEHFAVAGQAGLGRVAHGGEQGGPAGVREVLEICGAERIGHGIGAAEDSELMAELRDRGLPLEVCPSSNVALGAVTALADHPFDRLLEAGVPVTVNSDDPSFFDTSLTNEYHRLAQAFGYPAERLAGLSLAAVRYAFLEPAERQRLTSEFRRRFATIGEAELGREIRPEGSEARLTR